MSRPPRVVERAVARGKTWWQARHAVAIPGVFAQTGPLDLRILGRTLLHAALVGLAAGVVGAAFFVALEMVQHLLLEDLAGYQPLRAHGEQFAAGGPTRPFRPWFLVLLPALGGLAAGLLMRLAPETRGGGVDATIEAFHHHGAVVRRRVAWVKAVASLLTLGSGGSGGREGPTIQIGGALGSLVGRLLRVGARQRRILLVAGIAAGISAVFRTPLGAALLAVEVLYRDGFESDALVPSVLASVVAYSVVISLFGESTLFAHSARFPFVPVHLPLYALLAIVVAALAVVFLWALARVRRTVLRLPVPEWARPAAGGLALGLLCTPMIWYVGHRIGSPGQGLGILGGGYGAVQMAITGSEWLPSGWTAVGVLGALALAKLAASSLTIGSGGSAGDFAPSLAIGGLAGGAFGRAAQLLLDDPRIDPGAFALVGMGVFYGGIAHVPLSAIVLVCEMAGNYDLLVPLMLAQGIALVTLREQALYQAQVATLRDSPVHRDGFLLELLETTHVADLMTEGRTFVHFEPGTPAPEMARRVAESAWQDVFPVHETDGRIVGIVSADALRVLAAVPEEARGTCARDVMQATVTVSPGDDLRTAAERLVTNGLRELLVVDAGGNIIGFLDEARLAEVQLKAAARGDEYRSSALPSDPLAPK